MHENIAVVEHDNSGQMAAEYSNMLQEVYIAPIRSVLVVDDEFPSLDGLLEQSPSKVNDGTESPAAVELLRGILKYCRTRPEPWLVDVHDARRIDWGAEAAVATHLHHSDLMILDYHLKGEGGGGDAAVGVLKRLASNSHFNLVVVYTKGYQQDIEGVFYELVSAFADPDYPVATSLSVQDAAAIGVLVDELLDNSDETLDGLDELFTLEMYLSLRYRRPGVDIPGSPLDRLRAMFRLHPVKGLNVEVLFSWLMARAHGRFEKKLAGAGAQRMGFQFDRGKETNWIRLDSLFITVVNKQYEPSQIESSLLTALERSDPTPHQLMMAKMRAHMDERGVVAESEILNDVHMQAGWLTELLGAASSDRVPMIRSSVDKHWEALGDKLRSEVDRFALGLLGHLSGAPRDVLKRYFGTMANDSQQILARLNAYNNAKPVQASHLMTGHVLRLTHGEAHSFWVCLSPACDLVPAQKLAGWKQRLGTFMPFAAVRLDPILLSTALKKASDNLNIFLPVGGKVEAFSFCPEGNASASPVWEQMFASEGGAFDPLQCALSVTRLHVAEGGAAVQSEVSQALVVAQLRYEYALNLLQRLGANLSRVGLDYQKS
jgi:hypothetical protein